MAMGMSYDEYWNGSSELPKYYREKYQIETSLRAQDMWMQGAYVYDTLCRIAPLYDFMNKKREPLPYMEHPYPTTPEQQAHYAEIEARKKYEERLAWMKTRADVINEQFSGK